MAIKRAPKVGRPAVYDSAAEKQAAYVARKGKQMNIILPLDVADALDLYMERHAMDSKGPALSRSDTIAKLIRTQLLRKR